MRARLLRLCAAALGLGVVGALALQGAGAPQDVPVASPQLQTAADARGFDPGNIISDAVFFAGRAMDANEIQSFLNTKGATCVPGADGTPCLKDYRQDTTNRAADSFCSGYSGAAGESAATIIAKSAVSCGVSPRVLLVVLQKEQGLVNGSGTGLYAMRYQKAMGFACPDTAACDAAYYGFQNQVYSAARQYVRYASNPNGYAYRAGRTVNVLYNPDASCGSAPVTIANQATAGLYIYTPYQPNDAALAAGYGRGDGCSAYGNRNFWLYFTDWFGSTQVENASATLPRGALDAVTSSYGQVTVSGWALDPDRVSQSLVVHAYVDGAPVVAVTADRPRPDVGAVFPGAGNAHGFSTTFPTSLGVHQVCVYAINIGAGTVNPQLGCLMVDNQDPGAPSGVVESLTSQPGRLQASGWTFDPDVPSTSIEVRAYVDGSYAGRVTADSPRPDVSAAYGVAGSHGFSLTLTVSPGPHQVCIYAINQGLGSTNPTLACATMTVENPRDYDPVGLVDQVVASGGTVALSGWVFDKDVPTAPVTVHVYVDGSVVAGVSTSMPRADVAAAVPGVGGFTGYAWSGVIPAGRHQVCVFAINTGFGTTNPLLGCRTVTTLGGAAANPIGTVEQVAGGNGELVTSGWAFDPDSPTSPVTVHVYVDGSVVAAVSGDGLRPDVAGALGVGDDRRGWSWRGSAAPGRHQVCLYAINTGAGSANPQLGCRTVTVADPNAGRDPIGTVDQVTASAGSLGVSGWAYDPDAPTDPVTVHVYVDGVAVAAVPGSADRPDVAAAIPGASSGRGYSWTGAATAGPHQVCVFAINAGLGTTNPLLGCRTVTVR